MTTPNVHVCSACGKEQENQKHILQCNVITEINDQNIQQRCNEYEEIFGENVEKQIELANIPSKFQNSRTIKRQMKNIFFLPYWYQVTRFVCVCSFTLKWK